jgi:hypothetical protein
LLELQSGLFRAAGSDCGWRGWIAALDAATGKRE